MNFGSYIYVRHLLGYLPLQQNPECTSAFKEKQDEYYNKDTAVYMGFAFIYRSSETHEVRRNSITWPTAHSTPRLHCLRASIARCPACTRDRSLSFLHTSIAHCLAERLDCSPPCLHASIAHCISCALRSLTVLMRASITHFPACTL
jgi:hypothetical protein